MLRVVTHQWRASSRARCLGFLLIRNWWRRKTDWKRTDVPRRFNQSSSVPYTGPKLEFSSNESVIGRIDMPSPANVAYTWS